MNPPLPSGNQNANWPAASGCASAVPLWEGAGTSGVAGGEPSPPTPYCELRRLLLSDKGEAALALPLGSACHAR